MQFKREKYGLFPVRTSQTQTYVLVVFFALTIEKIAHP